MLKCKENETTEEEVYEDEYDYMNEEPLDEEFEKDDEDEDIEYCD